VLPLALPPPQGFVAPAAPPGLEATIRHEVQPGSAAPLPRRRDAARVQGF
jgi:hypothetical protein